MTNIGDIKKLVDTMAAHNKDFREDLEEGEIAIAGAIDSLVFATSGLRTARDLREADQIGQLKPGSRAEHIESRVSSRFGTYNGQMERFYTHVDEDARPRSVLLRRLIADEFGNPPAHPLMAEAFDHVTLASQYAAGATQQATELTQRTALAETQSPEIVEAYANDLVISRNGLVTAIQESDAAGTFFGQYYRQL